MKKQRDAQAAEEGKEPENSNSNEPKTAIEMMREKFRQELKKRTQPVTIEDITEQSSLMNKLKQNIESVSKKRRV